MSNKEIRRLIHPFSAYTNEIQRTITQINGKAKSEVDLNAISSLLNGRANTELKRLVPTDVRKQEGIFFTGSDLSDFTAEKVSNVINRGGVIFDAACGAGDLLLGCAKLLPKFDNIDETIKFWESRIFGFDLHNIFAKTTRLRLILLAAEKHLENDEIVYLNKKNNFFPGIQKSDFLNTKIKLPEISCVVLNPPFGYSDAPKGCTWASGKVQIAALFIEKILTLAKKDQQIVAILPDVLRSGTRYKKWRKLVEANSKQIEVQIFGRFDKTTDVDVFILNLTTGKASHQNDKYDWPYLSLNKRESKISDFFNVKVGAVVPHRDPKKGPWRPFLACNSASPGKIIRDLPKRRFSGTAFIPPFVVLRRTSSPSDKNRVVANIVSGKKQVAVENHLIALIPKDNSISTCKLLLNNFKKEETKKWLNERIRCRHLTVSALKNLPWWEDNK